MRTKTIFISVIFTLSFLSIVDATKADWLGCRLGQWNNYYTDYRCTGGDYSTDCPSTYKSGSNCYYDYCYCGYSPNNYCVYDDLDSNPPSCPERAGVDTDKCLSGGHLECTSSGWECKYSSVTPVSPEGPPGDDTCKDGIDNDCDGYTDSLDEDCKEAPPKTTPCSDNDNGKNYGMYGVCTDGYDCKNGCADSCSGGDLTEYYCADNRCKSTSYDCPDSNPCQGGACLGFTEACVLPGGRCYSNSQCCKQAPYCGDKTSTSCYSAFPTCLSSWPSQWVWAYECPSNMIGSGGCYSPSGSNNWLYFCHVPELVKNCGDPDGFCLTDCDYDPDCRCSDVGKLCKVCATGTQKDARYNDGSLKCCGECLGACSLTKAGTPKSSSCPGETVYVDMCGRTQFCQAVPAQSERWFLVKGVLGQNVTFSFDNPDCISCAGYTFARLDVFLVDECSRIYGIMEQPLVKKKFLCAERNIAKHVPKDKSEADEKAHEADGHGGGGVRG